MYLKSILFFYVASFFFQCQGVLPTEEQITMIKDLIAPKLDHDGKMNFSQLNEVVLQVQQKIYEKYGITNENNIDFGFQYDNDQVEIAILSYIAIGKPELNRLVRDIVENNLGPETFVPFKKIKAICVKVAKAVNITPRDFTSIDVFRRLELKSNRMFRKDYVVTLALAFAATKEPGIREIVKEKIQRCDDSLFKYYEEVIAICTEVQNTAHVPMELPTYEQFIEPWKNGSYAAETVQNAIIRHYFP
ncbi:uncharacterized protein LOC126839601 [Adelges cooleyi]|uniref:uncharacterized protein LOC126839601 n=1 Tax=Adelges cooleyi TaxID=133065 RepID=UPI00217F8565|nr:uncharacterized protein LOC126839601 [Adelges cooleyi]